jgi:uncharacterized protein (DUF1330 family)
MSRFITLLLAVLVAMGLAGCANQPPIAPLVSPVPAAQKAPKGYTIAEIAVNDPAAYREYVAAVTPLIAKHGGVYLVRAGKSVGKEGAPPQGRIVVLEFPSFAAAQAFYDSAEYQAIIGLRTKVATSRVILVEGVGP